MPRNGESRKQEREIIGYAELPKNNSLWTGKKRYFSWVIEAINQSDIEALYFFSDRLRDNEIKEITKKMSKEDVQGVKQVQ